MRRLRGSTFLVTLNARVTAAPRETPFANLAALLVNNQVPYALGMRFPVADPDALTCSRVLYSELARGSAVKEAVYQARVQLAATSRSPWAVGVPVLYTSLVTSASAVMSISNTPHIVDPQPPTQVSDLPRAEGTFRGPAWTSSGTCFALDNVETLVAQVADNHPDAAARTQARDLRYDYNLTTLKEQIDAMVAFKAREVKRVGIVFAAASIDLALVVGVLLWQAV